MARSNRDIFEDHVTVLVRQLGVAVERLTEDQRRRLFDEARTRRLDAGRAPNEHEAALLVAYGHVAELRHRDLERARVLVDRLGLVGRQWRRQALVTEALVEPLERQARAQLAEADGDAG